MPDIKTALEKALSDWEPTPDTQTDTPTDRPYFTVTNNVTRITFAYVRDNPGKTRKEIALALEAQGYKTSSVTSLLGQMLKQKSIRESSGLLYVTTSEYTPIKSSKKMKAMSEPPQRKIVTITRRAAPEAEPTPVPPNAKFSATIPQLLDTLSVVQARELYDALRKIFGG
jgi:predicted SPOUT superfamily RNA methylase MTH1